MGRIHTIKTHPQRTRIDNMIADGIPVVEIARQMGVAKSTLARYASLEKSEMAKVIDDEPGVTLILSRLVETAEHARAVRQQSKLTGSPVAQSRAIKGEAEILSKLLSELGIEDASIAEFLDEAQALAIGVRLFVRTYPEPGADLLRVLADNPDTKALADALRNQVRK